MTYFLLFMELKSRIRLNVKASIDSQSKWKMAIIQKHRVSQLQSLYHVSHLNTIRYVQHVCIIASRCLILLFLVPEKNVQYCQWDSKLSNLRIDFFVDVTFYFFSFGQLDWLVWILLVLLANWELFIIIAMYPFGQFDFSVLFLLFTFSQTWQ